MGPDRKGQWRIVLLLSSRSNSPGAQLLSVGQDPVRKERRECDEVCTCSYMCTFGSWSGSSC